MRKKRLFSTMIAGMLVVSLTACGSTTATTTPTAAPTAAAEDTATESATNTISFINSTLTGQITAIDTDTNTMTVSLSTSAMGGMGGMMQGGDTNGTLPTMPSGDSTNSGSTDGTVPEMPSGDNSSTGNTDGTTPPAMPSGDSTDSGSTDGTVPEMPSGDNSSTGNTDGTTPPAMPSGDSTDSGSTDGTVPTMPDGTTGSTDGTMPDMSGMVSMDSTMTASIVVGDTSVLKDAEGNAADFSAFTVSSYVSITTNSNGAITEIALVDTSSMNNGGSQMGQGGQGMPGGSSSGVDSYTAVTEITEDTTTTDQTYTSTGTDENAVLVDKDVTVTLNNVTVSRTSSSSTGGDNSSFYGVGAAILNTAGLLYVNGGTITTDSAGGAGVFSYGTGVTYVKDVTITTTQNTSGGIHAAGGGTLYAYNCNVTTNGESAAAIRSDRGGGTMVVDGGTYTSNGTGSPAVYCTADITINDADLTATGSEAVCIEGLNTLRLFNCDLTGSMPESSQNDCTWNIIVYQSMSGDSEVGNGTFAAVGGSITATNGGMFYTTNTDSTFYLSNVTMTYAADNDFFLKCTGNSNARGWGSTGSNGAQCNFTADSQAMEGNVIYDSISTLDFYMENGSTLKGAFVDDESNAGNGGNGYCNVYISSDSTWTVTGDSTITNLYNAGTILDENGAAVTIVGTDGTVYVQGTSTYTVTVSSYSTTADFSGATTAPVYSDYAVAYN